MKAQWLWGAVVVIILVGSGWYYFSKVKTVSGEVKLGVIAGTTGDYAAAGEAFVKGFQLAEDEWNSSHPTKFDAVIEDDGFNAQKGVSAYTKLKDVDHPDAYVVLSSFTIDAIIDSVHKEGKPVALGFEQSTPASDDNIFQVLPAARPIQQGLGEHLKQAGYKKPLVVVSNSTSVYANFYAGFVDGYGPGVMKEEVTGGAQDVRTLAAKILAEKPDIIVFYMEPPTGALLVREILTQAGAKVPPFAFDQSIQSGITDYQKVFGASLTGLDGSIVALSKNDLTDAFKTAYQQKYSEAPAFGADMGYNAFMALATTYASSAGQWINSLKSAHYTGADGDVSFDAVGLRVPNISFVQIEKGQFVEVK